MQLSNCFMILIWTPPNHGYHLGSDHQVNAMAERIKITSQYVFVLSIYITIQQMYAKYCLKKRQIDIQQSIPSFHITSDKSLQCN